MLTYNEAFRQLFQSLLPLYDTREAAAIAHEYLTHLTGADKLKRLTDRDTLLTPTQQTAWQQDKEKLSSGTPLQYITGHTWFMSREFIVNEHVLIPRPETEELVTWIIDDHKEKPGISIADIGTGSGCIAISLKLGWDYPTWIRTNDNRTNQLTAFDISPEALTVATQNAQNLHADITLQQLDILDPQQWQQTGRYDVIVSNPPYIPVSEQANMHINVKDHEPSLALFVPDADPLLFYRAIAQYCKAHLNPHGAIYCELHADHAHQTAELFKEMGYPTVTLRHDIHGNPRMLKAQL